MPRRIVKPADLDLDSPGRRDYYVALEHDTMWGSHLIRSPCGSGRRQRRATA